MAIRGPSAETEAFLLDQLDVLEREKAQLQGNEAIESEEKGKKVVQDFALDVFNQADNEEREGLATQYVTELTHRVTAKKFLAASNFLELGLLFGDIDNDTQEKIKYAKYKTAEIMKASREKGPEKAEKDVSVDEATAPSENGDANGNAREEDETLPSVPGLDSEEEKPPVVEFIRAPEPKVPQGPSQDLAEIPVAQPPPPSKDGIDPLMAPQAQKHCRWAISALNYEDYETAKSELHKALDLVNSLV